VRRGQGFVVALSAALAGCPAPELMDPTAEYVPLSGIEMEAVTSVAGASRRLAFRGHAYGYQIVNGRYQARYLDAGEVRVGGWRAERQNVRVGEPEYVLERPLREASSELEVALEGRGQVPACTVQLRVPVVALPQEGAEVALDGGLVLPLAFDTDSLPRDEQVTVEVQWFRGDARLGAGTMRWSIRGSELVVPPERLAGIAPGEVDLVLRLEWRHASYGSATTEGGCVDRALLRGAFEARRRVVLRAGAVSG